MSANTLLLWLRRLSASDTAVRAVEQSLLDWKYEVDKAPDVAGAFASDARLGAGIGRLIGGVVWTDAVQALKPTWLSAMLRWMVPAMAFVVLTTVPFALATGSMGQLWWWGVPGAALPYAVLLAMTFSATRPPALGFLVILMAAVVTQLAIYSLLNGRSLAWLLYPDWALLLAFFVLLGDRLRREMQPRAQLVVCAVVLLATRGLQAVMHALDAGIYRSQISWVAVAAPAALWLFYLWKQERRVVVVEHEVATA